MFDVDYLDFAKKIARKAGEIMKKRNLGTIQEKGNPSDLVTEVDKKISDFLIKEIQEKFPDHSIISEEEASGEVPEGYTWIIDPVDGTLPYAVGFDYSAVLIALMKDKKPIMGVIYQPFKNMCLYAEEGKGAFLNGKKAAVSERTDLKRSVVSFDYTYRDKTNGINSFFLPLVEKIRYIFCFGCAGASSAHVAKGDTEGAILNKTHLWDIAAAYVIVNEAGGKATNLDGSELVFENTEFTCLFSNGLLHEQMLHELKEGNKI